MDSDLEVTIDDYLTSAAPSNHDNIHNNVGGMDGSQGLEHEGEEKNGKVREGLVEEHQIVKGMTDEHGAKLQWQIIALGVINGHLQESYRSIASEFLSQHGLILSFSLFFLLHYKSDFRSSSSNHFEAYSCHGWFSLVYLLLLYIRIFLGLWFTIYFGQ